MSALDDVKEKFKSNLQTVSERVQETSIFQSARDRFTSLSPGMQKSIIGLLAFIGIALIVAMPLTSFMNSVESVGQFEQRRDLIHDLYRATQEIQNSTGLQPAPPMSALQSRIEMDLKNNLIMSEQIKAIQVEAPPASLPKDTISGALLVSLAKLNLRQIVDVGSLLQGIGAAIKVLDMDVRQNPQDSRYYDVIYKLVALNVPSLPPPEIEPEQGTKKAPRMPVIKKSGADE